ncbi:MAG: hypothetical protein KGL39_09130 [Patescibacteria group bacterium]|nr:hypothetical protein [Patescibacteria group bacterium]
MTERACVQCGGVISDERRERAALVGIATRYCSYTCAHRAANARWYVRRGKPLQAHRARLRRKRKLRKQARAALAE